jgi:hypothetical protein
MGYSVYFEERSVPIKLAFLRQITQIDAKLMAAALIFYIDSVPLTTSILWCFTFTNLMASKILCSEQQAH